MAKQTIRPLEDRVVIQQIEAEEKTAGGIVLPDTAKEKPSQGEPARSSRSTLKSAIECCSENGRVPRSRSTVPSS